MPARLRGNPLAGAEEMRRGRASAARCVPRLRGVFFRAAARRGIAIRLRPGEYIPACRRSSSPSCSACSGSTMATRTRCRASSTSPRSSPAPWSAARRAARSPRWRGGGEGKEGPDRSRSWRVTDGGPPRRGRSGPAVATNLCGHEGDARQSLCGRFGNHFFGLGKAADIGEDASHELSLPRDADFPEDRLQMVLDRILRDGRGERRPRQCHGRRRRGRSAALRQGSGRRRRAGDRRKVGCSLRIRR